MRGQEGLLGALERKRVISIDVSVGQYSEFIRNIVELAERRQSSYVCVANVHMTVEAQRDREFQEIVNSADLVTPDGVPLIYALRILYGLRQERVAGMDLMPDLIKESEKRGLSVFFFGSTRQVLDRITERIKREFPELRVAGSYSPPFKPIEDLDLDSIANMIEGSRPNIVLVSLGCPKQERFMAMMKGKINAVMIGVGGAFPVFAGLKKRAPRWMQKIALEWLYRLIQEPQRLALRYAYTNTLFLYLLAREVMRIKS